eukprot:sb/3467769/
MMLATADLIACPYLALYSAVGVWREKNHACWEDPLFSDICENKYAAYAYRHPPITAVIYSHGVILSYAAPIVITGTMAITRLLAVRYPLLQQPHKPIVIAVILFMLYCPLGEMATYFCDPETAVWFESVKHVHNALETNIGSLTINNNVKIYLFAMPAVLYILVGVIATALTVHQLVKLYFNPIGGHRTPMTSTIRILVINGVSVITFIVYTVLTSIISGPEYNSGNWEVLAKVIKSENREFYVFQFFANTYLPTISSLLNPTIYLLFSPTAVKFINRITAQSG